MTRNALWRKKQEDKLKLKQVGISLVDLFKVLDSMSEKSCVFNTLLKDTRDIDLLLYLKDKLYSYEVKKVYK